MFLGAGCFLLLNGCRPAANDNRSNTGVTVTDADGKSVAITDASRIVAIGTAITETVYALGAGGKVVGVDSSSPGICSRIEQSADHRGEKRAKRRGDFVFEADACHIRC